MINNNLLLFNEPARVWEEALPLGNGRLGAMVFGGPGRELIELNEDSVWSGGFRDRNNPAARGALPEIRRLLAEGRIARAEERCIESFSGIPAAQRVYQSAGKLTIDFSPDALFGHGGSGTRAADPIADCFAYRRELDLSRAVALVSFERRDCIFKREYFVSAADNLILIRFSASKPGMISFRAQLGRGIYCEGLRCLGNDTIVMTGGQDIPFRVLARLVCKGGTARSAGGFLISEAADEALLFVDIRTAFRSAEYEQMGLENLDRAAAFSWEEILARHLADYQTYYRRLTFDVSGGEDDAGGGDGIPSLSVPTGERRRQFIRFRDDSFIVLYYNYCRYLLISCSRPGTLPANLQGIWNPHMDPPWGAAYTININTQMNYWPACMCNLAETEMPLFDLLERAYPNGKKTAQTMYGCQGFVMHNNTDIWGDSAPRDYWLPGSYWPLGAAWLALHIWEHYEYTLDRAFLKKYRYLISEACRFFADFLIPGGQGETEGLACLVISPSVSPENSYRIQNETASICAGCEMDNQILRKLFAVAIRSAEILGEPAEEPGFREIISRIPEPRIHPNGGICEWNPLPGVGECEEADPGHRHLSHLWALWPGDGISPDATPRLAEAARRTLERRLAHGGGHTGWSRAWIINFYARLWDGDRALEHLETLLNTSTLPNLFDDHPPFQIDGNFGALSGITGMILQSRLLFNGGRIEGIDIRLLPALPARWKRGRVGGLRVKGNWELDLVWKEEKPEKLTLRNKGGPDRSRLRWPGGERELTLRGGEEITLRFDGEVLR
jgi:alpha-L-fucosidase 2